MIKKTPHEGIAKDCQLRLEGGVLGINVNVSYIFIHKKINLHLTTYSSLIVKDFVMDLII